MSEAHPLLSWRVQLPFWICTVIWGTTWIVIRDQLGVVPPSWSIAYRFAVAAAAMFAWVAITRENLAIGRRGQAIAMIVAGSIFFGNFNFVYRSEAYITSGLVALIFALLIVPNTILSRIFLGTRSTPRFFAGAAVAMAGIALLLVEEYRGAPPGGNVGLGILLVCCGVMAASIGNVIQASASAKALPTASLLAWGMLWGTLFNGAFAWATVGAPVFDTRTGYWLGVIYLGVFASAIAFLTYFNVIRRVGPAVAAYSSIITPVIAMVISTIFEDFRWTALAAAGGVLALVGLVVALTSKTSGRSG